MQEHDGYWLVRSSIIDNSMFLNARGLSPVIVGTAQATGADTYRAQGQPLAFEREADGRVHTLRVGDHLSAVR